MAQVTELQRRLVLEFQVGTTSKGQPKLKSHNFAHCSTSISDDDLLAVGEALAALFPDALYQVTRLDSFGIVANATTATGSTVGSTTSPS